MPTDSACHPDVQKEDGARAVCGVTGTVRAGREVMPSKKTALDRVLEDARGALATMGEQIRRCQKWEKSHNELSYSKEKLEESLAALDASEPDAWCCPVHPERRYNRQVACDVAIMDPNHSAYRKPCGTLMVALYARSRHE